MRDVTRAKSIQQQQRERLDALGQMANGIANELRTPVVGIASAAQLLRFRAAEDPVIEKNVGRILHEAERLNRMVSALQEYGRVDPLRLAPANPDDVWDRVLDQQKGALEQRSLIVERVHGTSDLECAIDTDQLAIAFGHLLSNAIQAAPEASNLLLTSTGDSGGWSCRLRNNGEIITGDDLPRVFDLFFTTRAGRAGIGLATARRLIEKHGGSIEIASIPDSGTTVAVTLPVAT